ncbi:hypothetical protein TSUD_91530 [Trifolium subterraneum]|uniref:BED-type domain-containing protein n=1 Tax=Trifolium subterraneum TaxID=3900 RepID=A0A2Z6PC30_TRISU|nr:hypothetical protein TSUD_91530 [Trifolium subterraneum]
MNVYGTFETSEQEVCTPMPTVSNTANPLPPRSRKNRSEAWDHFTVELGEEKKAKCYYCGNIIKCDNGTSAMIAHWRRCQNIPTEGANKRQKSGFSSTANMEGSSIISKFDQVELRRALVKMFIALELPFRNVDHEALHNFINLGISQFKIPSRTTLSRDILLLWENEKTKLKTFFSQHCGRVCLTTDFWTSCQNASYMSLTAHCT